MWALKCYHCDHGTVSQCQPKSGNKSSVLKCTSLSSRCFKRKITQIDAEDMLDQGCTNEDGCRIHANACASSGDCTASCCEKDLCNNGANGISKKACALTYLAAASIVGLRLLVWRFVPYLRLTFKDYFTSYLIPRFSPQLAFTAHMDFGNYRTAPTVEPRFSEPLYSDWVWSLV